MKNVERSWRRRRPDRSGLNYPMTVSQIQSAVNLALASGDRDTMLNLAKTLDDANNKRCPLN